MAEEKKLSSEAEASFPEKTNAMEAGPESPEDVGLGGYTEGFDETRTKKLLRKMDWNIVPFFSLLYLLSFLDRTNIGNARLVGLEASLGMSGIMYNIALAIFFPFYVAAEIPSNIMLKRLGAKFWFPFIMVCWGITMTLMGVVKNFSALLVVRAILGFAEGGLFPGVTWYLSVWYRRHECALRMAIFFSAATAAGAFGGLLARGIAEMSGVSGLPGWAWIFILEGIATVIVSIIAYFVIAARPETAKFLTPEERVEVARRLKHDRSHLADEYHIKYFYQAIQDWKIWVHMFITIGIYTGLYSFSLFLPTIVSKMGFQNNEAQLLTVPPYVVACIFTVGGGFLSDRSGQRGIYMIFFCCLALIGWIMLVSTTIPAVQYVGTVFAACGIYPNVSLGVAWNGNNIGGSTKRAVGIAMHVGFGNLGGTIGAFLFLPDRPSTVPYGTLISLNAMALVLCIFMTIYLRRENARRDRVALENGWGEPKDYTVEKMEAEREKGDYATFFRYTI